MSYTVGCRLNDIPHINKYLKNLNSQIPLGDELEVNFESKEQRKERIFQKFVPGVSHVYYFFDFILKRVFPKWSPTKKIYFRVTKGRNRVLSTPEVLGRIVSCGFKILNYERIDLVTVVRAIKVCEPAFNLSPTYGALIKLSRVGLNGAVFNVYKFRTMHPFSEYIQEYIYKKNQLKEGGKIASDFRITHYGAWMRRVWIDELPMLYNLLRGELKLVGVRPLSPHFFQLYPEDIQKLRTKTRPGLIPPFYADLPKNFNEVVQSEHLYLIRYLHSPLKTDWIYFCKAIYNILFKRARSN
jgi:hypothetical protein